MITNLASTIPHRLRYCPISLRSSHYSQHPEIQTGGEKERGRGEEGGEGKGGEREREGERKSQMDSKYGDVNNRHTCNVHVYTYTSTLTL